ncbi:hypothetical protein ACIQGZ_04710 [Streptomyces sp. NPDC092296]|uniref:hypothetical protein n=1 Tax=Streptomyces sp. NPDC092296 TaxID=3366012 RepID=UPI0037F706AE
MSQGIDVDPAELRASAHAADAIAQDMAAPDDKAVRETAAAAQAMTGWTIGPALDQVATGWKPALQGMHDRVTTGAANLRACADGHEWNEDLGTRNFEHIDDGYPD